MLELARVDLGYGDLRAVQDLSLVVRPGEIVTLLGANGAGKSTTLAAIMGIVRPAGGNVHFDGVDITGRDPEEIVRLGMTLTPEGRRLFAGLTVAENLALGAATRRDRAELTRDREAILELFPIVRERLGQTAGTLSGGEQQQLAIARSLMAGPRLLLLDEPSLGLAPRFVDLVFELIARLRRERGLTILLVEQNVDRALRVSDRGYVLNTGRLELEGASAELLASSEIERAYLGIGEEA